MKVLLKIAAIVSVIGVGIGGITALFKHKNQSDC